MMEQSNLVERWSRWEPIEGLDPKYYLDGIIDSIDELRIRLISDRDQSLGVDLTFDSAWCYRVSYESFRADLTYQLGVKYGIDFGTKWTFFKVEESDYLSWFSRESYEFSNSAEMTHYCLLSLEAVVDIAASTDPVVSLIKL